MNLQRIIISSLIVTAFIFFYLTRKKTSSIAIKQGNAEQTLAIIKPDAVAAKNSGKIIDIIEHNGFDIAFMKKMQLPKEQAEKFYAVHKGKRFYNDLITFMTSNPVIIMILEKENAIKAWRELMGNTNPKNAQESTIRNQFGTNIQANAVHGSDAPETARDEIEIFYPDLL